MGSLPRLQVADAPTPTVLGRYSILEKLGTGGMAVVYKAWDPLLQVHRAVKVLHTEASSHSTLKQRFITEASTLTRLVHPNVLRIYEVGEDDGKPWYAMDLVEEGAVQRRLEEKGPMPAAEALRVIFQVLQALGAAHACGIIHRDVKPQNVLLRADGTALLGDFGSARQAANMELTRTGDVLGTIGYMAPEQRNDSRRAGPAADIYAAGATLYGLVTGRAPLGLFEGQIDALFLARLPEDVREVLRNATRYRPEHRYPSARHMAMDVARAWDRITGTHGPEAAHRKWIARFDLLMENSSLSSLPPGQDHPNAPTSMPPGMAPGFGGGSMAPERKVTARGAAVREETPATTPQPVSRKEPPAPSALATAWTHAVASVSSLWRAIVPATPAVAAPKKAQGLAGTWDGRMADLLPLRLELEAPGDGRVVGWAVTTGMRGEVVTRVEGTWSAATGALELAEQSERPDRGRYSATYRGGVVEGSFQPVDPAARPMSFTLIRAERGSTGRGSR